MENRKDIGSLSDAIQRLRTQQSRPYHHDRTGKFIDYWFSLPKKGLMPKKSDIDPRGMLSLLPGTIMLEKQQKVDGYRIRLIGTQNTTRWGFEATNANYLNFAPPQQHSVISEIFSHITEHPCGLILSGDELYTSGRIVRNEMALFPVSTNDPENRILFGLITAMTERDTETKYGEDTLASLFYTISATHYVNIGAGVPV